LVDLWRLDVNSPWLASPRSAYIHVPFCRHRCGYCNFTLVAGRDDLIGAFLQALAAELAALQTPHAVDTIALGGGTPTHLPPAELTRLLELVRRWFVLAPGGEFTVEANPADLTEERCDLLAAAGVSRLSLGVQSFSPRKLALLERDHTADEVAIAVARARRVARSVSLDLIFGVPGETTAEWSADLDAALALAPDHLSCYGLTFEKGAPFWSRRERGELTALPEELEAAHYERAIDTLSAAGLEQYEVSNFARPGHRSRHNETYWLGKTYFAAGPGAARYVGGVRELNHRSTTAYIQRVLAGQSPVAEREELAPEPRARERLVFALQAAGRDFG
jgi:oxygen-independent coproporphyrinogen-3 oxidase